MRASSIRNLRLKINIGGCGKSGQCNWHRLQLEADLIAPTLVEFSMFYRQQPELVRHRSGVRDDRSIDNPRLHPAWSGFLGTVAAVAILRSSRARPDSKRG
jgi:hypothetical protein